MTPNMSDDDMDSIQKFIRKVGEELAAKVATTQMEAIARAHVQEEFKNLIGVDTESASEVRTFMANMAFLHRFRALSEKVGATMILTVVTIFTGGAVALIWGAIKNGAPIGK